jgi:hypothetical protein
VPGNSSGDGSTKNINSSAKKDDTRKNFFNPTNEILPPSSKKGSSKENFFKKRID